MTRPIFTSVDALLADARSRLNRLSPHEAAASIEAGARLVDIRPMAARIDEGEIPGTLVVERNHLEWRLHPSSAARMREATAVQAWIVFCSEGYTSSLAADTLRSIGVDATDLIGGFRAWQAAGLPTAAGGSQPVGAPRQ
jgi:rhodanese-related sulfurtransferase